MRIKTASLLPLFLLLITLLFPQIRADNDQCKKSLQAININIKQFIINPSPTILTADTKTFMTLSGRFVNDYGEYDVCQNQTATSHYLSLNFTGTLTVNNVTSQFPAIIGFCSPLACSAADALNNTDLVFQIFSQAMGLPLKNLTVPDTISFYDPRDPHLGSMSGIIAVLAIFLVVTLPTLIGTGFGIYYEFRDANNAKKEEDEKLLRSNRGSFVPDFTIESSNMKVSEAKSERKLRGIYKFLDCFDARKNFDKLTTVKHTDTYDYNLEIFNGIRVFMMLYVVYGHSFMFGTNYIDNLPDLTNYSKDWWLLVLFAALYSVDVFLYMSGFLTAYIGLGKLRRRKPNIKNYVGTILHRVIRIWPSYALAIIFFWKILPLLGEGPIWFKTTYYTQLCDGHAWQNFLFIDDLLAKSADYCFGWGWYLSNDLQMFMLTPIFLWLYCRRPGLAKLMMIALICVSWILALVIGAELNVRATPPIGGGVTNERNFAQYYVKPYIRLPPYFIGILVALWYKEFKEKKGASYTVGHAIQSSKFTMNLIWFMGIVVMLFLVLLPRQVQLDDQAWPDWFHYTWRAFQKSVYVIAMTMIILPILMGENTLLKRFLSHPLLVPLARISFTAYLVHLIWIYRNFFGITFSFHFSYLNGTLNTLSNAALAFLTGLILSLIAEVPMANIETTYISGGGRRQRAKMNSQAHQEKINGSESIPIYSNKGE